LEECGVGNHFLKVYLQPEIIVTIAYKFNQNCFGTTLVHDKKYIPNDCDFAFGVLVNAGSPYTRSIPSAEKHFFTTVVSG
jgi:hypothetical protein